uniref:Uncharacterized protein n=1 Tax=Anguilla anguilla TaxID=7936 RepID=A0A0E9PAS3_ANGAN
MERGARPLQSLQDTAQPSQALH